VRVFLAVPDRDARTGALHVVSEPEGATVTVDGIERGTTPITIVGLSTRTHTVVVEGRSGRAEQRVRVDPETTTEIRIAVYSGWLQVLSRLDLQILEGGQLIGTSDIERIMLPAGRHTIDLVADRVGFMETREVVIEPGGLTRIEVTMPPGRVQIEAPAGHEVHLDGEVIGTTPLPPIEVPLGTHNVRVKGPQMDQQRAFLVTVADTVRLTFGAVR
jgi:hypothetical protein